MTFDDLGKLQQAVTLVGAPAGWSGRVYIGTDVSTSNADSYIYYQHGLTGPGACAHVLHIGNVSGQLFAWYRIFGSSSADEFWELYGSDTASPCPGFPTLGAFEGGKIQYYARNGNDFVFAPSANDDRVIMGEGGDDHVFAGNSAIIDGGDGQDKEIVDTFNGPNTTQMLGQAGDDLLCHYGSQPVPVMNGGSNGPAGDWGGYDTVIPINANGTEGHASQTTCNNARVAAGLPINN